MIYSEWTDSLRRSDSKESLFHESYISTYIMKSLEWDQGWRLFSVNNDLNFVSSSQSCHIASEDLEYSAHNVWMHFNDAVASFFDVLKRCSWSWAIFQMLQNNLNLLSTDPEILVLNKNISKCYNYTCWQLGLSKNIIFSILIQSHSIIKNPMIH